MQTRKMNVLFINVSEKLKAELRKVLLKRRDDLFKLAKPVVDVDRLVD